MFSCEMCCPGTSLRFLLIYFMKGLGRSEESLELPKIFNPYLLKRIKPNVSVDVAFGEDLAITKVKPIII